MGTGLGERKLRKHINEWYEVCVILERWHCTDLAHRIAEKADELDEKGRLFAEIFVTAEEDVLIRDATAINTREIEEARRVSA